MESPTQLNDMRVSPQMPLDGETHRSGMSLFTIVALIIILLAVGALFILSGGRETVTYDEHGNPITHVAAGMIAPSFPDRFLVEEGVDVAESYTIDYTAAGNLLSTVRYASAKNLEDNINAFGEIFVTEGWTVVKEPKYEATETTNFYAIRDREQVNVVFVVSGDAVEVIISHLVQS